MKSGKTDVSGSYSSEVLLHGPDELFVHLASVFRSFLVHGDVTEQLLCCAFLPLFKGGLKNPDNPDSYRAIAGSSLLLKLFENVVLLLWGHLLTSDTLLTFITSITKNKSRLFTTRSHLTIFCK